MNTSWLSVAFLILVPCIGAAASPALNTPIAVCSPQEAGSFPLVQKGAATALVSATEDTEVVRKALAMVAGDIQSVTGKAPQVLSTDRDLPPNCVIAGTLGKSKWIDALAASGAIPAGQIRGKWETFALAVVDRPFPGVNRALVIAGSDRRGTAYGVTEISRIVGISPWIWWADVTPEKKDDLAVTSGAYVSTPPAVKYRGFFLNDEDWSLRPWAMAHLDSDVRDIGPKTYERVFELMLRLRANVIWPAMHPGTGAFYHYPENPELADAFGIVVGSSHAEPMLRNNVYEWKHYEDEFHEKPQAYRYDTNQAQVDKYWRARVQQSAPYESVYTLGMRGIHDSPMEGPKSVLEKVALLDKVVTNERAMLSEVLQKPAEAIPQIFCPYKEVLDLYRAGLKVPSDVTLLWVDDNHGYLRQLSNPGEQKRSGGAGVYYHFSYWGSPEDYLWLSSVSPALTSIEMHQALATGADRMWIFNVGGLKKCALNLEYAMDLAWSPARWTPQNTHDYFHQWAASIFGDGNADEIAGILDEYYRLAQFGKPEHVYLVSYTKAEAAERLKGYADIAKRAQALASRIPPRLQDAYFELITYPVVCSWLMNEKVLDAKLGQMDAAQQAYQQIQDLTGRYSKQIAGGKWDGMVDWRPRKRTSFEAPNVYTCDQGGPQLVDSPEANRLNISKPSALNGGPNHDLVVFPSLGFPDAIGRAPSSVQTFSGVEQAPWAEYSVPVSAGPHTFRIRCLPSHPLYAGLDLRIGVSINGAPPVYQDLEAVEKSPAWSTNVLRGYTETTLEYTASGAGTVKLRIIFPDPGAIVSSIDVTGSTASANSPSAP